MESQIEIKKDSPADLMRSFLEKNGNMAELRELLALQKEYEANEAMKAFNKAMVDVQGKIQAVVKTKRNDQTKSKYAELDQIISHTKPVYTEGGFSVSFYEGKAEFPDANVRVCADVVHSLGHKQHYYFDVPLDGVGIKGNANMTKIHAKASSVSYGRRYLMCMIFNIPTSDDNDGNNAVLETITEEQAIKIEEYLESLKAKIDRRKFLGFFQIESVEAMPKNRYQEAINLFKSAEAKK